MHVLSTVPDTSEDNYMGDIVLDKHKKENMVPPEPSELTKSLPLPVPPNLMSVSNLRSPDKDFL